MSKAILGKKLGMTQVFTAEGQLVPVTVVETTPSVVVRVKTVKGQFDKAGVAPVKYLREVRVDSAADYTVGQTLAADIFAEGELVDVVGTGKGKGFAGTIKRHNFSRGPETHGSKSHREPGSIGPMISVVKVDAERNLLLVKGGIPGAKGSLVMVRNTVKPVK